VSALDRAPLTILGTRIVNDALIATQVIFD